MIQGAFRRFVVVVVSASILLFAWAVERGSVERANRLHRDGLTAEAAVMYSQRAGAEPDEAALRYNLGTALLSLGEEGARSELQAGIQAEDRDLSARAFYNTGLWHLSQALDASETDSTRAYAAAAVSSNRTALKLRPDDPDTKWNLAIAQRMLDSIDSQRRRSGDEDGEGAVEADAVVQSELMVDVDTENELPDDAPQEGEEEALVDEDELGGLSASEAAEILGRSHLDASLIVQKLLALEGRSFLGRRFRQNATPRR